MRLFMLKFYKKEDFTMKKAKIAIVAGVIAVLAVRFAQDGYINADAVASVSLCKALYFPVGHEMRV